MQGVAGSRDRFSSFRATGIGSNDFVLVIDSDQHQVLQIKSCGQHQSQERDETQSHAVGGLLDGGLNGYIRLPGAESRSCHDREILQIIRAGGSDVGRRIDHMFIVPHRAQTLRRHAGSVFQIDRNAEREIAARRQGKRREYDRLKLGSVHGTSSISHFCASPAAGRCGYLPPSMAAMQRGGREWHCDRHRHIH
jgi:hypothetical protein